MGSEIILLLLAGVGGCHGSRECCASLCVWRGYFFANPLGVEFSHKFHPNTPLLPRYVKNSIVRSIFRSSNTILDANTPLKSWGVAAVSDGVFVFWYILDGEELVEKKIHLDGIPKFSLQYHFRRGLCGVVWCVVGVWCDW